MPFRSFRFRRSSSTTATSCTCASGTAVTLRITSRMRGCWSVTARTTVLPEPDLLGAIEEFVTGSRSESADADRFLATVLFVDVVGSTQYASEFGDQSWRAALDRFEHVAAQALLNFGGTLERATGDGVLATFEGPARAIRCASHLRDEVRRSGLEVRCGLHAGEVAPPGGDRGPRGPHRRSRLRS